MRPCAKHTIIVWLASCAILSTTIQLRWVGYLTLWPAQEYPQTRYRILVISMLQVAQKVLCDYPRSTFAGVLTNHNRIFKYGSGPRKPRGIGARARCFRVAFTPLPPNGRYTVRGAVAMNWIQADLTKYPIRIGECFWGSMVVAINCYG